MRTETQEKLLKILFKALKPLVHMLLESGIGHREFSQVAKMAFVDVATKNYGIRGRDTNISRVAVMTGLTRKEVKKVRDSLSDNAEPTELRAVPASIVLHKWFFDPDYCDQQGVPRVLQFEDGEHSFKDLVRKYAGDIPPGAIRTELKRTAAVKVDPDGRLRALRRGYRPSESDERILRSFEGPLTALLETLKHNTVDILPSHIAGRGWPERMVLTRLADDRKLKKVREGISSRIENFSEELDDVLEGMTAEHAKELKESSSESVVGVGLYYFQM